MPIFQSAKRRVAITLGDPAGIGPEITLKALHHWGSHKKAQVLLVGDPRFFEELAKKLRLPFRYDCFFPPKANETFPEKIERGKSNSRLTALAVRSIELAVSLAMEKKVDLIVTPPINKAALKAAGYEIPGHTEYLAALSRTKKFEMMLVGGGLRVVLVTRHVPIEKVAAHLSRQRIEEAIVLTDENLRKLFGIRKPRIGVCSLNPHAGEQGTIGDEENKIIAPAVRAARRKIKSELVGPLPPDVLFYQAYRGRYDAEICMYHDQGQIPLKMISRGHGVNVTLGLPFARTSPDHGTAYDIADKFVADPSSMIEALNLGLKLCPP